MKPGLVDEIGGRGRERFPGAAVALTRFAVAGRAVGAVQLLARGERGLVGGDGVGWRRGLQRRALSLQYNPKVPSGRRPQLCAVALRWCKPLKHSDCSVTVR